MANWAQIFDRVSGVHTETGGDPGKWFSASTLWKRRKWLEEYLNYDREL